MAMKYGLGITEEEQEELMVLVVHNQHHQAMKTTVNHSH